MLLSNGPTPFDLILDFNERFGRAVTASKQSERDKLLVQAGGFLHLQQLGGLAKTGEIDGEPIYQAADAIMSLFAERNIKNKVDVFNHCSQLVLGYVVDTITDKVAKKEARNLVDRGAKLFKALHYFAFADPATFPSDEVALADWIAANGGIDGVVGAHKEALGGGEGDISEEVVDFDLDQFGRALDINGITATPALPFAPDITLSITRMGSDGNMRIVPLSAVPASVIGQLAPYLPALDAGLPDQVRYWANVSTVCMMFDRQVSDEVARPDEETYAGSSMMPSLPIVMLTGRSALTVAASRVAAGVVVRVTGKVDTVLPAGEMSWPYHFNGSATKKLMGQLAGGVSRASFNGARYSKDTRLLTFESRNERIKPFSVRALPLLSFGSSKHSRQWTIDIRSFSATGTSQVELENGKLPDLLTKFAVKAATGRHATVVKITKGNLTFAQGDKAAPVSIPAVGDRSGIATISSVDLFRVVNVINEVGPISVKISIDTGGLVEFDCETRVARYQLFVPTLLEGGVRNPAMFERVERPRSCPAADEAASASQDASAANQQAA
ncbi:hypothetical protein [Sphingomonas sp. LR55]|uniref:hypothetical protein n=1 Tax=Sphingomonas sp. LR55 TaxID=3050231 RepID=UPI002FE0560A